VIKTGDQEAKLGNKLFKGHKNTITRIKQSHISFSMRIKLDISAAAHNKRGSHVSDRFP
jgi:hypothetical protein